LIDSLDEVVWMHPTLHLDEYKKSSNQRSKNHILYLVYQRTKNHILYLVSNNFGKLLYTPRVYSLSLTKRRFYLSWSSPLYEREIEGGTPEYAISTPTISIHT